MSPDVRIILRIGIALIVLGTTEVQGRGLVATGKIQPVCEPYRTFKGKFVQDCTSYATSKLVHLTTPGFSDFYKGNIWVLWTITTKSILAPIRLVIEVIDIDCEAGYLLISEGSDKSQKICGIDERWPNIVGQHEEMHLNLLSNNAMSEFRLKISFMAQDSKCGKMVRNYPRSIDPCVYADRMQKMANARQAAAAAAPRSSNGRIVSKHAVKNNVFLKSAGLPKQPLPQSAFDVLSLGEKQIVPNNPPPNNPSSPNLAPGDPFAPNPSVNPLNPMQTSPMWVYTPEERDEYVEPLSKQDSIDLKAFQNELDRRYWNLDNGEEDEESSSSGGLAWLAAFIIIIILIALTALSRYYYLRYERLKLTEYTIKEGNVKVELKNLQTRSPKVVKASRPNPNPFLFLDQIKQMKPLTEHIVKMKAPLAPLKDQIKKRNPLGKKTLSQNEPLKE